MALWVLKGMRANLNVYGPYDIEGIIGLNKNRVAVKELKLSYHNSDTMLFAIYIILYIHITMKLNLSSLTATQKIENIF